MERPGLKPIDELVRLAMIGDGAAFTKLWDTHIDSLRAYIRNKMTSLDDFYVEDVCSKSFEKAFRQIATYDPAKSQFSTWLKKIAYNTALDTISMEKRSRNRYVSLDGKTESHTVIENLSNEEGTALDSIIKDEDKENLLRHIEGLPDLYRDIARMRLIEGLQYKEISEELGMEMNTVRTRIRRAKGMIDKMKEEDNVF